MYYISCYSTCYNNVIQSLTEREEAVAYKDLMRHLQCGAEIEALTSAQRTTSFLSVQSKCISSKPEIGMNIMNNSDSLD